jgi:hypothetical protein
MSENLRIYVLGAIQPDADVHELTVLAEHRGARAMHRMRLARADVEDINRRVSDVRTFIELGTPSLRRRDLQDLGERLAAAALLGRVRSLFDGALAVGRIMPLELVIEDGALAVWPWEYLFDTSSQAFVCENFQPICRCVFSAVRDPAAAPEPAKLRILLAVGVDSTDGGATPDSEVKWIKEVFNARLASDAVDIRVVRVGEPQDLQNALVEEDFDVLHYYGHGDFDGQREEAYLSLQQRSGQETRLHAEDLAAMVMGRKIRFVFLNACKTGTVSAAGGLARSGMAPALVNRGVAAVVATQFVMPDTSAHYLASMVYNSLALGRPIVEAVREGRRAMKHASESGFIDWGIPVLYARDATIVLRPGPGPGAAADGWRPIFEAAVESGSPFAALATPRPAGGAASVPSVVVERTARSLDPTPSTPPRYRVALVDYDSKVAFLPDLVERVNAAQTYFQFSVAYLPIPSGAVRTDFDAPQLYLPRIRDGLKNAAETLKVDMVCCLTRNYLAGEENGVAFWNYLGAPLDDESPVVAISTGPLRGFAQQAGVSFAKAVLYVCLSEAVLAEGRWPGLEYHKKTAGCMFDFCETHSDIVIGLEKMAFTHDTCRGQIKDPRQLAAIDALIAADVPEPAPA